MCEVIPDESVEVFACDVEVESGPDEHDEIMQEDGDDPQENYLRRNGAAWDDIETAAQELDDGIL